MDQALERTWSWADGLIPRTARKQHACCGFGAPPRIHTDDCTLVIRPGQRYVEYVGEAPAYASGIRYSIPCAIAEWGQIEGVNA